MSLPFDASLKALAAFNPAEFLGAFDPRGSRLVKLLNVDLSTVSAAADIVFGLGDPLEEIVHIDCQASAAEDLHRNVLFINALLHRQHRVAIHSIILLLRPQARHRNLTGSIDYAGGFGSATMKFTYDLVEVWKRPAEEFLTGALGAAPLAVLGRLPDATPEAVGVADVLQQLIQRLDRETSPRLSHNLGTAAAVLSGLRLGRAAARELLRGLTAVRESETYQAILDEGRDEGRNEGTLRSLRAMILRLGRRKFGEPDATTLAIVQECMNVERLERLTEAILDAAGWDELLATV